MKFPLVLDLATDGIPVAVACRVRGLSKQAFYAWKAAPPQPEGITMFETASVPVTRYRWRAHNIPTLWATNAV